MSDGSIANSPPSFSPTVAASPAAGRPVAARTKLLLEGPVLSTLLRLSAPNILNLLAIAGMITFDGLFVGRLGRDALAGGIARLPVCHADTTYGSERYGWCRLIRNCPCARCRQARYCQRACAARSCSGPWPCGGILDSAAARRTICLSMDGRTRRGAVRRLLLLERGVQRRNIDLHAESARQCCARNRQYGSSRRRHRRQRDRARSDLAVADFRVGAVAGPWSGRCRLGFDHAVRRRQSRAAR